MRSASALLVCRRTHVPQLSSRATKPEDDSVRLASPSPVVARKQPLRRLPTESPLLLESKVHRCCPDSGNPRRDCERPSCSQALKARGIRRRAQKTGLGQEFSCRHGLKAYYPFDDESQYKQVEHIADKVSHRGSL